jgi:hypothetical protein
MLVCPQDPIVDEGEVLLREKLELLLVSCWEHVQDIVQSSGADGGEERVTVPEEVEIAHT